ncbi:tetratricopeptide repeat protein [Oceanospirillum sediminis]|uniref:Tetratricopeptide repeat protein n=1 Tax=Oceanospirillum sediminis TaxID=2760088 RepID=A0A839IV49_9GAMM|nr:tetratricopeptide repeat protein [Oceanospirillum sediminis]MBB1489323.1 tetratricopeptide repeat protein [Oceanospirillum sediminis]
MRGFIFPILGCVALMTGCQSLNPSYGIAQDTPLVYDPAAEQAVEIKGLNGDSLAQLLAAEIAGQREQFDYALQVYLSQASEYQHPQLAERATWLAQYAGDVEAALDAATLWSETDSDNKDAHQMASTLLVQQGELLEAFDHQKKLLELGESTHFSYLAERSEKREALIKEELLLNIHSLLREYPDNPDLLTASGQLLIYRQAMPQALRQISRALQYQPDNVSAIILKAGLVAGLQSVSGGVDVLREGAARLPDNLRLQLALARGLLKAGQTDEAQVVFQTIADKHPDNGQLALSLALILMENGLVEQAKAELEKLLSSQQETSSAHYYLGRLAEQENDLDGAVFHYQEVLDGKDFLQAHARAARIQIERGQIEDARVHLSRMRLSRPDQSVRLYLIEAELLQAVDRYDDAMQILSDGVERMGNDYELLYSRAMIALKREDIVTMEQDLRLILEQEPNNAMVLNTLGYSLTEYTERYQEAMALIRKAYDLKPGDPAITDSLGWVYFKLGQNSEAILLLSQAYEQMQDPEIATHLIEVFWAGQHKEEARSLLDEALELFPDNPLIERLIERFPELKQQPVMSDSDSVAGQQAR